ncbi:hypothetical protein HD597_011305 [Nonomuraea thailandensis]|uniref:Uncharacterized protein n=1 Tax=Nonomuraea thailandensis TaxID=1188745 RepID=A0A9X2K913_9ACTN|nr:hypothetical protein [Nonomuraea thailandensis]MCP2364285.1 hypothetical protein [Nonomuraea thailandensis]
MTALELARVGYDAYGDHVDWVNHAGNVMPRWRELPKPQREAWTAAAEAIERAALKERGSV